MPPAPLPDFRWFFRTLRVVPVVAVAALTGGIIGGFSVFAIDVALTAPPNHGVPPEPGSKLADEMTNDNAAASPRPSPTANSPTPMRTFDAVPPVAGATTQAATGAAPSPAVPARPEPDLPALPAVAKSNLPADTQPASAQDISPAQPAAAAMTSTPSGQADGTISVVHPAQSATNSVPNPVAIRRHVAVKRSAPSSAERTVETSSERGRPVYDDGYGRPDNRNVGDDARAMHRSVKPAYDVHRRAPADVARSGDRGRLYDRYDRSVAQDDDDNRAALPAQPPPLLPFFGLFGGSDRN